MDEDVDEWQVLVAPLSTVAVPAADPRTESNVRVQSARREREHRVLTRWTN